MRKITKILIGFFLSLFLCVSSFAQNKIAVINGYDFYDEKSGIKILTEAVKMTYDCDFQSLSFRKKINYLKSEISNIKSQGKSTIEKDLELSKIEKEFDSYQKLREETKKKRYSVLIEPIEKRIKDKLKLFKDEKGYIQTIDLSDDKIINAVLYFDESIDITTEFIKFCNEEFEKEKSAK